MPYTLILHFANTEPVMGEVEEMPLLSDNLIALSNPRMRDGKDLANLSEQIVKMIYPVQNLTFIEVLAGKEEEEIFGFVRE
jgi:hypothetical protein